MAVCVDLAELKEGARHNYTGAPNHSINPRDPNPNPRSDGDLNCAKLNCAKYKRLELCSDGDLKLYTST